MRLLGLFGRKGLIQRTGFMSIQVVYDLCNLLGLFVMFRNLFDEIEPIEFRFVLGGHENVVAAASLILVVVTLGTAPHRRPLAHPSLGSIAWASHPCKFTGSATL